MKTKPVVLCFSGHDPCGGAGIQADIEVMNSHDCHTASVITCLTQQDTHNVYQLWPQSPEQLLAQANTLIQDMVISAIKIGLIGDPLLVQAIATVILQLPEVPVIFDPVLAAGGGQAMSNESLRMAIRDYLLPITSLLTPNTPEARLLSGQNKLSDCAEYFLNAGVKHVLITGGHENSPTIDNTFYAYDRSPQTFHWERLPHHYHGSGCTLASACAALMARGFDAYTAVSEAQDFTWQSLAAAYPTGQGQLNPNRFFWYES